MLIICLVYLIKRICKQIFKDLPLSEQQLPEARQMPV